VARFYLDEDVSPRVATFLISWDHDVRTTAGEGRTAATDASQLLYALSSNRILVTHNKGHFVVLHQAWHEWSQAWEVGARHPTILALDQALVADVAEAVRRFVAATPAVLEGDTSFRWRAATDTWELLT
jgi:hypothetical protein